VTLREQPLHLTHAQLLLDLKTNDEGAYEFNQGFTTEADILTAMASSSHATLEQVYAIAQKAEKDVLIDLLEVDQARIKTLMAFDQAIFGLHHAKDAASAFDAIATTAQFHQDFPQVRRIAVAGGIDLAQAKGLAKQGIAEILIVGSNITGASDPVATAQAFMEAIK
jgi:3-hexulose-6-phosphate synthase